MMHPPSSANHFRKKEKNPKLQRINGVFNSHSAISSAVSTGKMATPSTLRIYI
jgi:hypothetical protein